MFQTQHSKYIKTTNQSIDNSTKHSKKLIDQIQLPAVLVEQSNEQAAHK